MNKLTKELMKKNNIKDQAILEENEEIYTNMVVYLRGSDLTEYNQEMVREDIIELIIEGQRRGDNIQKVMGSRYKETCDEIIAAMPKKTKKEKIVEYVGHSLNALWILGVILTFRNFIVDLILKRFENNFIFTVGDMITTLAIIVMAQLIVKYITKSVWKEKQTNSIVGYLKTWIVLMCILAPIILISVYLNKVVISFSYTVAIVVILMIFIASKIINSKVY
ncbi:hypothetical protein EDC19_2563 [Natranaerovirga hydrolytica]|uniref:Uncharacterized protein n=1 Tax=Natranaerovirga hydrolytica TaxID=680378 RepID=A0A4R1MAT3_9FIRM|nr:hypothetical protein [Natranaerovirga hydrolytica]TCK89145.1 hypothetical protein EDC19_2563 [Natranaerovirga hydrolytica]